VIGISNYPPPIESLDAAGEEAARWADLFRTVYAFDDVTLLRDAEATRKAVTKQLSERLLANVMEDDEIAFVFCGHGCKITPAGSDFTEETLFLYPETGGVEGLGTAGFTASDFARILIDNEVPATARVTIVLDTCFGAAFGALPFGAKVLFVQLDGTEHDRRSLTTHRFGLLQAHGLDGGTGPAIIVAAASENQVAIQTPLSPPRLVFSMLALNELQQNRSDTYRGLIANIAALAHANSQDPDLYGNLTRADDKFVSGPPVPAGVTSMLAFSALSASSDLIPRSLKIQIAGTCCFVDRATSANPFIKRLVLPFDNIGGSSADTHIAFIEVPDAHIQPGSDTSFLSKPYPHKERAPSSLSSTGTVDLPIMYRRFVLSGHTIEIDNIDTRGALTWSSAFVNHVPKMTTITPELFPYPRAEVFDAAPQTGLISAFFDISYGALDVGPLYQFITHFKRLQTGVETSKYQTPQSVTLLLQLLIPPDMPLTIRAKKGTVKYEIKLDDTADVITIGNELEADIVGPGSGDDVTHHFGLYYNLATQPPPPYRAVPVKTAEPINSCTVTGWP
jgi:hypothetical protein